MAKTGFLLQCPECGSRKLELHIRRDCSVKIDNEESKKEECKKIILTELRCMKCQELLYLESKRYNIEGKTLREIIQRAKEVLPKYWEWDREKEEYFKNLSHYRCYVDVEKKRFERIRRGESPWG